jgi:hypothetical protein
MVDDDWLRWKENFMVAKFFTGRRVYTMAGVGFLLIVGFTNFFPFSADATASPPWRPWRLNRSDCCPNGEGPSKWEIGGEWHWMRSPDEEKRVVMGLYNRYCIRCHGVDGRGIWDIPGVPNFTNTRWQASRSDDHIARIIIEGRGAVMPPFRGTLTVEESFAMARYLRTFVPGTEVSRPDLTPEKTLPPKLELPKVNKGL